MRLLPAPVVFAVVAAIFLASPVRGITDSRYSTLVSANLLRHGSLTLDRWFIGRDKLPGQVEAVGPHVYHWYPPGSPVLATPLVGALALLGVSPIARDGGYDEAGDVITQAVSAALLMALLAVVFLKTAQSILPGPWAVITALAGALGTQIWSTASRALWGDTFLVLILGVAIWLLVLQETGKRPLSAPLLATLLAWAYFVRPTASIAIVAVTLYVARHHRRILVRYVATGAGWLGAFVAWSWLSFGTALPSYYRIHAFSIRTLGSGVLGILFSPSRGQFIFVPVTLFVVYLLIRYARSLPLSRLLVPALVAVLGHTALMASFVRWYGGHCYGPRYLTAVVPWLVLLAAMGLRALLDRRARGVRLELIAGAVLLACSAFAQARGAWARETWTWNAKPVDINVRPERCWSWRDTQLLAGLLPVPVPDAFPPLAIGPRLDLADPRSEPYLQYGWSEAEPGFRWTDGRRAAVVFALERIAPLVLEMDVEGFLPPRRRVRGQRIEVEVNGRAVQIVRLDQRGTVELSIDIPQALLARENRLTFGLPDAAFASPFGLGKDPRQLAVAVRWLRLRQKT